MFSSTMAMAMPVQPVASASTTTTGGGSFTGAVTLPFFPCANCGGATFTGSVTLSLSGVGTSAVDGVPMPYSAVWTAPLPPATNASAIFGYDESCLTGQPDNLPPLIGTAGGPFSVTGGMLTLGSGTIGPATLSGTFNWVRATTGARLTLSALTITAPQTSAVNLDDAVLVGQGASGFVWSMPVGTCATQVVNQTATVGGISLQAA